MSVPAQARPHNGGYGLVVLEDERLMRRIDAYAHQQYDTEDPLDACPKCGEIQPGYRYCRNDLTRIPRKRGIDSGFWVQEVAGEGRHQEAFERVVGPVLSAAGAGVHLWVTAELTPDPCDRDLVQVTVVSGGPAEHVGHISAPEGTAIRKSCRQVERTYKRDVACKGLINGGFVLEGGETATFGISLLLPPVSRFLADATRVIERE